MSDNAKMGLWYAERFAFVYEPHGNRLVGLPLWLGELMERSEYSPFRAALGGVAPPAQIEIDIKIRVVAPNA